MSVFDFMENVKQKQSCVDIDVFDERVRLVIKLIKRKVEMIVPDRMRQWGI